MVTTETKETSSKSAVEELFRRGAHYGFVRAKRHPSARRFIFGAKDKLEIFDLEKTIKNLEEAKKFVNELGQQGKTILFVGGKAEARQAVREAAEALGQPYVDGRWKGGTLSNFEEIKKRLKKLEELRGEKESGELDKYTKKERLMIDREIEALENDFGGLISMSKLPDALFVVDAKYEKHAVREARTLDIPIISLSSSDCDFSQIDYPIPGNDASVETIQYVVSAIRDAYGKSA